MTREQLIDAVQEAMGEISDYDTSMHDYAVAVVDKVILPLRDDVQAAADQAIEATIKECNREHNEGQQ